MHIPILRRFVPVIFSLTITWASLFGSVGRLDWSNGWVLLGLNFAASIATTALLWRNPELLAERSNIKAGKSWDKGDCRHCGSAGPNGHLDCGGPYRFVRHPGYTGMSAFTLATPLILNSRWAFAPAVATAAIIALRTVLEDRTLHDELDGYADYASRVKYNLVPTIW